MQNNTGFDYTIPSGHYALPKGSLLWACISLIWIFISSLRGEGIIVAIAFTVCFGILAFIETTVQSYRLTKLNGVTYHLTSKGYQKSIRAYRQSFIWHSFKSFATEDQARFESVVKFLPLSSIVLHGASRYTIKLYYEKNILIDSSSEEIRSLPENHAAIIQFISQFIPRHRIGFIWDGFTKFVLVMIVSMAIFVAIVLLVAT